MAKLSIRKDPWKALKHKIAIQVSFAKRGKSISACASTRRGKKAGYRLSACGLGSNPRSALESALKRLGAEAGKRAGAFAGYHKKGKR
jgi:hypothetical protein